MNDLIVAIRVAATGGTWIPAQILTQLVDELAGTPRPDPLGDLRERGSGMGCGSFGSSTNPL